jgi:trigger factor
MKHFDKLKVEKLPNSEATVVGEITTHFLDESRKKALKSLGEHANIPGFRPGKIPEEILVKNFGEMKVLEETAEVALADAYTEIMKEAKLSPIGRPEVSITKIAPKIPLEFKIKVALEPEFTLPDYKKIAKEIEINEKDSEVTEKK